MNIECPSCQTAYDVPDHRLGSRRLVRCGHCTRQWSLDGTRSVAPDHASDARPAELELPDATAMAVAAVDRLVPLRSAAPRDALLTGAWLASAVMILGFVTAVYAWRANVVAAWPPSARLLPVSPARLVAAPGTEPGSISLDDATRIQRD